MDKVLSILYICHKIFTERISIIGSVPLMALVVFSNNIEHYKAQNLESLERCPDSTSKWVLNLVIVKI